jgi:hypothetical protein
MSGSSLPPEGFPGGSVSVYTLQRRTALEGAACPVVRAANLSGEFLVCPQRRDIRVSSPALPVSPGMWPIFLLKKNLEKVLISEIESG